MGRSFQCFRRLTPILFTDGRYSGGRTSSSAGSAAKNSGERGTFALQNWLRNGDETTSRFCDFKRRERRLPSGILFSRAPAAGTPAREACWRGRAERFRRFKLDECSAWGRVTRFPQVGVPTIGSAAKQFVSKVQLRTLFRSRS